MVRQFQWIFSLLMMSSLLIGSASAQPHFAEQWGWHFDNFTTPTLNWNDMRLTYIGVPPNPSPNIGVGIFFNQVYEEIAKDGNCYGMALLSLQLQKNGAHAGFCIPTQQYSGGTNGPSSGLLEDTINELHGYQVNIPTLKFVLDTIAKDLRFTAKHGQLTLFET